MSGIIRWRWLFFVMPVILAVVWSVQHLFQADFANHLQPEDIKPSPGNFGEYSDGFVGAAGGLVLDSVSAVPVESDGPVGVAVMSDDSRYFSTVVQVQQYRYQRRVFDMQSGVTTAVENLHESGSDIRDGALISADGSTIAFLGKAHSAGSDRAVFTCGQPCIHPVPLGLSAIMSEISAIALSGDGRWLAISTDDKLLRSDDDDFADIYMVELATSRASLVLVDPAVVSGDSSSGIELSLSHDGGLLAFELDTYEGDESTANVAVWSRFDKSTRLITKGLPLGSVSRSPVLSESGRFLVFSTDGVLTSGDRPEVNDVYVRDLQTGATMIASGEGLGLPAGDCFDGQVSNGGRVLAFTCLPSTSREGDSIVTGASRTFIRDLATTNMITIPLQEPLRPTTSTDVYQLTADGRRLLFGSGAAGDFGEVIEPRRLFLAVISRTGS